MEYKNSKIKNEYTDNYDFNYFSHSFTETNE